MASRIRNLIQCAKDAASRMFFLNGLKQTHLYDKSYRSKNPGTITGASVPHATRDDAYFIKYFDRDPRRYTPVSSEARDDLAVRYGQHLKGKILTAEEREVAATPMWASAEAARTVALSSRESDLLAKLPATVGSPVAVTHTARDADRQPEHDRLAIEEEIREAAQAAAEPAQKA